MLGKGLSVKEKKKKLKNKRLGNNMRNKRLYNFKEARNILNLPSTKIIRNILARKGIIEYNRNQVGWFTKDRSLVEYKRKDYKRKIYNHCVDLFITEKGLEFLRDNLKTGDKYENQ